MKKSIKVIVPRSETIHLPLQFFQPKFGKVYALFQTLITPCPDCPDFFQLNKIDFYSNMYPIWEALEKKS
jgi:hypothetical protein